MAYRGLKELASVLFMLAALSGCAEKPSAARMLDVKINDRLFHLELAVTPETQHQGLSDRAEIAADGGMLFVFREAEPLAFVMRRCPAPIDVIFLNPAGRVLNWEEMQVEPAEIRDDPSRERELKLYLSDGPGQFAIEVKGGTARTLGLRKGQKLDLPLESLKAMTR